MEWIEKSGVTARELERALAAGETGGGLGGIPPDAPFLLEICTGCEYFVDGCDFRDPQIDRASCSPCGGIKAVALLSKSKAGIG